MIANHSLPIVRVRVPCANDEDYRNRRAAEFLSRGVVVPSDRAREIGSRVRLRIELLDHTFAYDGEATVARPVQVGPRRGYLLRLTGGAETRPAAAGGPGSPAAPEVIRSPPGSAPAKAADVARDAPVPPRAAGTGAATTAQGGDAANLASFLFSDLNLADAAAAAAAAAAAEAGAARAEPAKPPPRLILSSRPPMVPAAEDVSPAQSAPVAPAIAAATPGPPREPAPAGGAPATSAARPRALPQMELVTQEDDRDEPPATRARPLLAGVRTRRRAAPVAAAVLLCVAAGGGAIVLAGPTRADADAVSFAAELRRADDRVRAGRLAGTGNDSALDHLVAARDRIPGDPRLTRRLKLFADLFGELGERALSRGDLEEAAVHFQANLRADPNSVSARQRLREIAGRPLALAPAPGLRPGADASR